MNSISGVSGTGLTVSCSATLETFPGSVSFGTDNTVALQKLLGTRSSPAAGTMNAAAAIGQPECLYFPAGNYLTQPLNQYTTPPAPGANAAQGYGCWLGDEHYHSNIFVIPNYQGDVFAWVDSYENGSLIQLGNTQTFQNFSNVSGTLTGTANQGGSSFRNLTIIGDRLSSTPQNGLVFYGQTAFAYIDNIVVDYLLGRAFLGGAADDGSPATGNFDESVVQNVRFEDDGNGAAVPAFEINANGGSVPASNTVSLSNIRIYQPIGTGLWIHNSGGAHGPTSGFRLANVFIEGSQVSATSAGGDLFEPGDSPPFSGGFIGSIVGRSIQLINPVLNYAALHVIADGLTSTVNGIDIDGSITGSSNGPGRGLQIETCAQCGFKFTHNDTADYQVVIGSNSTMAPASECTNSRIAYPGVTYDGDGAEPTLTSCIDPAAAGLISFPVRQTLGSVSLTTIGPNPQNAASNPLSDLLASVGVTAGATLTMGSTGLVPINRTEPTWTVNRSGPTASFTDYWDTGPNIVSALGGTPSVQTGQLYHLRICNQTGVNETITPQLASGTLGTVTLSSGVCLPITMTITGSSSVAFAGA